MMRMKVSASENLLKKAKECFERKELKNAEVLLKEIIEGEIGREAQEDIKADAYFWIGNIFHLKGQIGKAIKAMETCLKIMPSHTDASISLSVMLNDIGQYDRAKSVFHRADARVKNESAKSGSVKDQHINKTFSMKHFELAEMYFSYQRYDEAVFEYTKSSQLDPENLDARLKLAKAYAKKGFIEKAISELQRLKNEYPNYLDARVALGVIYYGKGKVLEAQAEWHKVISLDPLNKKAKMYLSLSRTATETALV